MTHTFPSRPLPHGLLAAGSIAVVLHLSAFFVYVIAQSSGPWPLEEGNSLVEPPYFAQYMRDVVKDYYLQPLRMTHTYRFANNRLDQPGVVLEARLKYTTGKEETLIVPQKNAWPWIRYRQTLLAQGIWGDQRVFPRPGEIVPAPNQPVAMVKVWESEEGKDALRLKSIPEHLIPRDRPVWSPSPWSELLARSYMRFLLREHRAASVELIRRSRAPIRPETLLVGQAVGNFDEMVCSFGEYREK